MSTIRTVTLNAGFDVQFRVSDIRWGEVCEVLFHNSMPSGKGVNLSRAAAALGVTTCCYALIGERQLDFFGSSLSSENVDHRLVPVQQSTRHNLTLTSDALTEPAAHMVAPGFDLTNESGVIAELTDRLIADTQVGDMVVLCGSLPRGLDVTTWSSIGEQASAAGALVALDVQGASLTHALNALEAVTASPNESEAMVLAGDHEGSAVLHVLEEMSRSHVQLPLVTLGGQGVAHLAGGKPYRTWCEPEEVRVVVGAGDVFLAATCAAILEDDLGNAPRRGVAAATAHVAGATGPALARMMADNLPRVRTEPLPTTP